MVSIIVVDDGILTNDIEVMSKVREMYYIDNDKHVCLCEKKVPQEDTHGGQCAYIIHDIFPDVCFVSLQILNSGGRCCGQNLKIALEWCVEHECDIVHMSLSTRSFYNYRLIKGLIYKLIKQGKLLVSSLDNAGVVSYPAAFKGVFAAFMDNKRAFGRGGMGLFYVENLKSYFVGLQYDKRKVNPRGEMSDLNCANSYAAAALTGYLAKFITKNGSGTVSETRKAFWKEICSSGKSIRGRIPQIFISKRKRRIPVIGIIQGNECLLKKFTNFYIKKNYSVLAFAESYTTDFVPLYFYLNDQILINDFFLRDMEGIYNPDLIIFQVDSFDKIQCSEIEILIDITNNCIEVWAEECKKHFKCSQEAIYYTMNILEGD